MRALVTGGAGFIGSHIVDALVARGDEVYAVDDLSSGTRANLNDRAHLSVLDIASPSLAAVMDEAKPDVVFHEAAQMNVRRSVADPAFDAHVNVLGSINLYENCVRCGVGKVVFASSGGCVYGEAEQIPTPETSDRKPDSPYGITKLANEMYLRFYSEVHGLRSVCLRYANVYGPRQNPLGEAGVVAVFMSRLLRGEQPVINGTGEQTRDYVYVGDVVKANLAALDTDTDGAFNVGTGLETNVVELYEAIREVLNKEVDATHAPAKSGEQLRSALDISTSALVLGWRPQHDIASGLRASAEWFTEFFGPGQHG
jgi:UDP-glucose 4-epimerase